MSRHVHFQALVDVRTKREELCTYIVYIEEYYITIEDMTRWIQNTKKNTALTQPINNQPYVIKQQLQLIEV